MKMLNFKLFNIIILIVFCLFIFAPMGVAFGEESSTPDGESDEIVVTEEQDDPEEESVFKNPTEAQRAINLAEAYAEKPDPDLEEALSDVEKAQNDLDSLLEKPGPGEEPEEGWSDDELKAIADAEQAIKDAEQALEDAQNAADTYMADNAGVTPEEIAEMRANGDGWGQICHDLGLHPSILGMRHTKMHKNKKGWGDDISLDGEESELQEATARNFKSGFSKGHGASVDNKEKKNNKGKSSQKGKKNSGNKGGKKK